MDSTLLGLAFGPGYTELFVMAAKSVVVSILGLLLWRTMKKAGSDLRHKVLGTSLAVIFLMPVFSYLVPAIQLRVLTSTASVEMNEQVQRSGSLTKNLPVGADQKFLTGVNTPVVESNTVFTPTSQWLLALYLGGVLVVVINLMLGIFRISRINARSLHVSHGQWPQISQNGRLKLSVEKYKIFTSAEIDAPMTWGVFRPVILIPECAASWSEQDIKNALLHEMAHVERNDWVVQIAARIVCAVYWFNPLVWITFRQLSLEAERAADENVLKLGTRPEQYVQQLVCLTRSTSRKYFSNATVTMAQRSQLWHRVNSILEFGENKVNIKQRSIYTLLTLASAAIVLVASAELVAKPQKINHEHSEQNFDLTDVISLLARAVVQGNNAELARLLASGNQIVDVMGDNNPLALASKVNNVEALKMLISYGANVNFSARGDQSAMYFAARNGNVEILQALIDAGASVDKNWPGDGNALTVATSNGHTSAAQLLLEFGASADSGQQRDGNALIAASKQGNVKLLKKMIDAGADVNKSYRGDGSPLIEAARNGNIDAVRLLLEAGAEIDKVVWGDENALIGASWAGDASIVKLLLQEGADPSIEAPSYNGEVRTALRQASLAGHNEVVELLVSAGAVR